MNLLRLDILAVYQKLADKNQILMENKTRTKKKNLFFQNFSLKAFFRAYNYAIHAKAISFSYPVIESSVVRTFLTCLEKETRIAGYYFLKKNRSVDIFLNYDLVEKAPLRTKFIFYASEGRKRVASLKTLQQFYNQNPTAFTLINTTLGLLTIRDCLNKKCGGEFLMTIT